MSKENLKEQQVKDVNGGKVGSEPTMKWCEKCQAVTEHDDKGNCLICSLTMDSARYRF